MLSDMVSLRFGKSHKQLQGVPRRSGSLVLVTSMLDYDLKIAACLCVILLQPALVPACVCCVSDVHDLGLL
jgi:hypothetical protein